MGKIDFLFVCPVGGFGRVQFAKMEDAKRALDSKHSSGSFSEIKQSEVDIIITLVSFFVM